MRLLIIMAIALRARQFFFNRSLWVDEAMLALNIVNRGFMDLLKPLDYSQGAPLGFLFIEKLAVIFFGNRDYVLRLFPLFAGILAIFIMAWLARRMFPGWPGLLALALFTFSWKSIYYASEVKQYGSDILFALILLASAYLCRGPEVPVRNWLWLLASGTLALWMSHPSVFVISGIMAVLGIEKLQNRKWQDLAWLFMNSLFWLVNFIVIYAFSLRSLATHERLHAYWLKAFMPLPPWNDWNWFFRAFEMIFKNLLGMPLLFGILVFMIGGFSMFRRNAKQAGLWLIPIFTACMASGFGKYPFWARFLLFTLPMLYFFLAAGIRAVHGTITRFFPKSGLLLSAFLVFLILQQPIAFNIQKFLAPEDKNDIKSVMAYLRANRRPKDIIYAHNSVKFHVRYYAPFYGIPLKKLRMGSRAGASAAPLIENIKKLAGRPRVWFAFSKGLPKDKFDQKKTMLEYLDRNGVQQNKFQAKRVSLYLYDLSR